MSVKIDFTASGGIDDKLYTLIKGFCNKFDVCLLCKEGDGKDVHHHAHAVVETKKRTDNLKRSIRKFYEDNGYKFARCTVCIKNCVDVGGALSYVYKDKCVLLNKGYILSQIKVWATRKQPVAVKTCYLTMGSAVDKIIQYCDDQGIKCQDYETFKYVLKSMAVAKYRVSMILRNIRPIMIDVLAHYGDTAHLESFLDLHCNMFA